MQTKPGGDEAEEDDFPTIADFERLIAESTPKLETYLADCKRFETQGYMTTHDLADCFGKSLQTIRRWIRKGSSPHATKEHQRWVIQYSEFCDWIDSLKEQSQAA